MFKVSVSKDRFFTVSPIVSSTDFNEIKKMVLASIDPEIIRNNEWVYVDVESDDKNWNIISVNCS